jgi:putative hemolysin
VKNLNLRSGSLEVLLAPNAGYVDAAQALRYRVFYEEMAAVPSPEMAAKRRDFDPFDEVCEHLLVIDHNRGEGPQSVVATYRLLRRENAGRYGYYSAAEYDISKLVAFPGEILELGRSCVDSAYRNRPTMQLMWRGISAYVFEHAIGIMFGCASLPGTDPDALAVPLSYLYHYHLAPEARRPRAIPERYVDMNILPRDAIDVKRSLADLPPLIKGYLRLGGYVGDGAVIDHQFNTTDVCIVVETGRVTEKYFKHYERAAREIRPD